MLTWEGKLSEGAEVRLTYQRQVLQLGVTAELDDREIDNTAIFGSKASMHSSGVSHNQGNIKQAKWPSDLGQYWLVLKKPCHVQRASCRGVTQQAIQTSRQSMG